MANRRRSRGRAAAAGALAIVRRAQMAAKNALENLRSEIKATSARLQKLVAAERSFRIDLFGGSTGRPGGRPARRRGRARPGRARASRRAGRRGRPRAEKYFQKLPSVFSIEDVRKLAGRGAAISLAQWSRAKRIKKNGNRYRKTSK